MTHFTVDIPGLKDHRYRRNLFKCYGDELASALQEIEDGCVDLRTRVTAWREIHKRTKWLIKRAK